jgi:DNA relaxase NicK
MHRFASTRSAIPAAAFLARFISAVGDAFGVMQDRGRGLHGYKESYVFERGGVLFAFGVSTSYRVLVDSWQWMCVRPDWHALVKLLRDDLGGRLTRLDGAHDDFEGVHAVRRYGAAVLRRRVQCGRA